MTLTWGTFRTQIRRSVLKDLTGATWTNDVLADLCGWALDTFCAHTAAPTGVTYTGITGRTLAVPDNLFSPVETTAVLYLTRSSEITIIKPALLLDFTDTVGKSYSQWGSDLTLSETPVTDDVFTLRYFAYYNHPVSDSDTIDVPAWARNPLAHLIGALSQTGPSVQSAGIDRYKDRKDSGNPEDNALRVEQSHLLKVYNEELARYPRQARESYFQRLLVP